jgi:hypothetical protein
MILHIRVLLHWRDSWSETWGTLTFSNQRNTNLRHPGYINRISLPHGHLSSDKLCI